MHSDFKALTIGYFIILCSGFEKKIFTQCERTHIKYKGFQNFTLNFLAFIKLGLIGDAGSFMLLGPRNHAGSLNIMF